MNPKRQRAGRLGGQATFRKYGRGEMSARGKKGGRPRSLTLEEIRQQQSQAQKTENEEKGGMDTPASSASLKELKRLYKLRQKRSTGNRNTGRERG